MNNLFIGDSLVGRDNPTKKWWICYSNFFKNNIYVNGKCSRNSGYLRNYKLNKKINTLIIQIGIVDCAPRTTKWKLLKGFDTERGDRYINIIPKYNEIKKYGYKCKICKSNCKNKSHILTYIKNNRYNILKKQYELNNFFYQKVNPKKYEKNISLFIKNNYEMVNNIIFIEILKPHKLFYETKHYGAFKCVDIFNNIIKNIISKYEKCHIFEVYDYCEKNDIFYDDLMHCHNDGYHLNPKSYEKLGHIFDNIYKEKI